MRNLFFSTGDGRLRAGWRIALFLSLFFTSVFVFILIAGAILPPGPIEDSSLLLLIAGLANALGTVVAVFIARRIVDRKTVESLGIARDRMGRDGLAGFLIAGAMMLAVYGWMAMAGWLEFRGFIWAAGNVTGWGIRALNMLLLFALTGFTEELQFRGYVFQNAEEGLSTLWAVIVSSAVFALMHLGNPGGAGLLPMAGLLLAGLFFAYAYMRTRSLWLAAGLHTGWNTFEGLVFGFQVSGLNSFGLLQSRVSGPAIWTGGSFGPEAGLVLLPALLVGTALVYVYTRTR